MKELPLLLGFWICASARHSPASPSFFEENPSASASDLLRLESSQSAVERFARASKDNSPTSTARGNRSLSRPKARSQDRFLVKTKLSQEDSYALCNTKSNANVASRRKGGVIVGSKGLTYSENNDNLKSLICKSKSFKLTNKNGKLKRVAAEGTAVLSNDKTIDKFLNSHKTNSKILEIGSSGKSAISSNASKKEVVAAVDTQVHRQAAAKYQKEKSEAHREAVAKYPKTKIDETRNRRKVKTLSVTKGAGFDYDPLCNYSSNKSMEIGEMSEGKKAGTSSMTKSRLVPHGLETLSSVDGGTAMDKKGLGVRSWAKEATQVVSNPRSHSRPSSGRSSGATLTHMTHRKKSNFEVEI